MLLNNIDTTGQIYGLTEGIYGVNLFNLETIDPNDYIRIVGLETSEFTWRYFGETDWRQPYFGNEFTEYADNIGQGLIIELNVTVGGDFLFRTDDTFEYPYDDTPTNPIIDIEVLATGEFSTIADDSIGDVTNNIISTENAVAIASLENDFFRTDLPYGIEGSGVLYVTDPSANLVSVNWQEDNGEVFFWNGIEAIELDLTEGDNQLLLNPVSDEWGFIVTDKFNANDVNVLTVNSLELVSSSFSEDYVNVFSLGDINEIDLVGNSFEIATGTGDRAVSTIGNNLVGERSFLNSYGTEGSYFELTGLDNGVYSFDVNQLGKVDLNNNDALYVYNGKDLTLVADNENGVITNEVDVIYGELSFIALDSNTKTGTTEWAIASINKQSELSYSPPERIDLIPDNYIGDIDFYPHQTRISTGGGDRAISTLGRELADDYQAFSDYGTEGSYATWTVENGIYEITYYLYTSEDDIDHDDIYFYDGENLQLFDSRSSATIQSSSTRWISEATTQQVEVINGKLTFLTLDTVDKSGTTSLRISSIEKVGEDAPEFDPITGYLSEPPYPIPNNGWDMGDDVSQAWQMGILKPWETDTNTGITWNQGYVYGTYHLGHSYISEAIGGDDSEDWATFTLDEESYINLFTPSNATTELLDADFNVIGSSPENNNNTIQDYLTAGDYYLRFSTGSGLETAFSTSIYLSKFDPNYAD